MLTLQDIQHAAQRIAPYIHHTPVLSSQGLDKLLGRRFFFKAEHLQKTGSFKARGALNAALQLQNPRGLIAVSSGNHAQGVAYAAQVIGAPALVVMPEDASPTKKAATRAYGAEVYDQGVTVENREQVVRALAEETGYALIHPFDDLRVMAGQGTQALELLQQVPDLDAVLVAVGGGGLISGIATVIKSLRPACEVIGVEPETANDAQQSLQMGARVKLVQAPRTVADGVRTLAVGEKTFPVMQRHVDRIVTVPDEVTLEAQRLMMQRLKQVVEPTAGLALGPALMSYDLPERVAVIVCGGNWMP
ncbi:threonine/serine dehydratase [Meiothermus ruber]|uniref:Pyridoxal-5'-phosphate-dependent protein beta subunit n=1 Tax=Meiothermus ruber (strain ATCC 35948 / DSM 1279 / VKM B-1258 / 21) TaxID=504728 RepID=D3PP45_MEIRD|nr:threonine/serine dehydratase [Meiothermus ruber]ADD27454.1 Pyridoxal-5'-phosphate-dependent protein beta subunit [Meiothermus ruber DSM 1279]AGK03919.1 pyridoxal-5'-phosphate-dependent protein subunit beta [Meiothermus ruber DSM 1279]MCL6530498.1 threonine/serine dehydratase [Meiothermus ruber]GAO74381.1 pyridoxal-5'-phosphate-dependent protein subunit beta [Meiothermus ruber H328]